MESFKKIFFCYFFALRLKHKTADGDALIASYRLKLDEDFIHRAV